MFLICFLGGYQKDVLSFWPFYYYKMFFFVSSNKYCHKVYFVLLRCGLLDQEYVEYFLDIL